MYSMCMFSERLQILVSPEQRRQLEVEAGRRGVSVSGLIREAVDHHLGGERRDDRMEAVTRIREMDGRFILPAELERIVEEAKTGRPR